MTTTPESRNLTPEELEALTGNVARSFGHFIKEESKKGSKKNGRKWRDEEEEDDKPLEPYPLYVSGELRVLPPPRWLIDGFLPANRLTMLYGDSQAGKTFGATNIMAHVAMGMDFAGLKTEKGKVCYLLGEGEVDMTHRLDAWLKYYDVDREEFDKSFIVLPHRVPMDEPRSFKRLMMTLDIAAQRLGGLDVLVVDTLNRNMAGDENLARDMGAFIGAGDEIKRTFGSTQCYLHHTGKGNSGKARGSSALTAALDLEVYVTKKSDKNGLDIASLMEVTKNRSRREGNVIVCKLLMQPFVDHYGDPQSSLVAVHDPNAKTDKKSKGKKDEDGEEESGPKSHEPEPYELLLLRIHEELPKNQAALIINKGDEAAELKGVWPKQSISSYIKKLRSLGWLDPASLEILPAGKAKLRDLARLRHWIHMAHGTEIGRYGI